MKKAAQYEKAKQLRNEGKSFAEIAKELSISYGWARRLVEEQDKRDAYKKQYGHVGRYDRWHKGLTPGTVRELGAAGIFSKNDCLLLLDDLPMKRRRIAMPGFAYYGESGYRHETEYGVCSAARLLRVAVVNEVREWLGAAPMQAKPKHASSAELRRAKELLERHGYTVIDP